jgi:phosphatidylinositol kinase/protein kinase (PI-3  family)
LYLRDELTAWQLSGDSNITQLRSKDDIRPQVVANAQALFKRIQSIAPQTLAPTDKVTTPINNRVMELITNASDVDLLSQMDPTWHPWL